MKGSVYKLLVILYKNPLNDRASFKRRKAHKVYNSWIYLDDSLVTKYWFFALCFVLKLDCGVGSVTEEKT